ncbi:YcaO-like family protein [Brevibacillus sedimenti]|uniref:YcaO-like family protein n=1 Tax=Brevibacillus sedimenti TaxID=2613334 RepID=UPI001E415A53|nr:YcaO-like family protein [Anoxybacillus sediminis]UFJ60241.1 YcaO-like family protein [Anoxybacillus sediminis]
MSRKRLAGDWKDVSSLGTLRSVVSRYGGIVRWFADCLNDPGDQKLYAAMAAPTYANELVPGISGSPEITTGVGFTREEARRSAVGEAIERYCGSYYVRSGMALASWRELKGAVHPERFAWFHPDQYLQEDFPFVRFTEDTKVRWVPGYNLTRGQEVWVPAAAVWENYLPGEDEALVWRGLTTGLSCAPTAEEAVLRGILEIVERDSYSIMWHNKLSLPRLNVESNKRLHEIYQQYFAAEHFRYHLVDTTTTLGIPAVCAIMKAPNGRTIVGAASRPSLEEACIKALCEIAQQWMGCRYLSTKYIHFTLTPDEVEDFVLRPFFYCDELNHSHAAFVYQSTVENDVPAGKWLSELNVTEELDKCIAALERNGLEVIAVDITLPDVRQLGLHVYRVIVPGAVDITRSEKEKVAGGTRLYQVPVEMGYLDRPYTYHKLNPMPHPLP